jgi:hypothetical protein
MTGPGGEMPAGMADRGRLRASHADREQVIEALKAAFVQGRLAKDEFDARVGQAFASRTCAELAVLTADLPAGLAPARPPRVPARAKTRPPADPAVRKGVRVTIVAATVLAVLLLVHPDNAAAFLGMLVAGGTLLTASSLTVALMLESRQKRRAGGQLPPRPGPRASDRTPRRLASGPPAELGQIDHGQQPTAEAARSQPPGRPSPGSRSPRHYGPRYTIGYAGR